MSYCAPLGIPHSEFLGWSEADQAKAIAWKSYDAQRCSRCGTFPEEWIDPVTKRALKDPPYTLETVRCGGCVAMEHEEQVIVKSRQKGVYLRLRPRSLDK